MPDHITQLMALYEELYLHLAECEQVLEELTESEILEIRRLLQAIAKERST